jgi:hypothetical protein
LIKSSRSKRVQQSRVQDPGINFALQTNLSAEDDFVRKISLIAAAGAATFALAGVALAAKPQTHVMDVALPDGSVAHIQYVGDVAPKVTLDARPVAMGAFGAAFPSFAGFDRMMAEMNRQAQQMARQAEEMARQAPGAAAANKMPYVASYGGAPAGMSTSTSVVSYSDGKATCTRTTEVVSQGAGKPPKVTSSVSGNCGSQPSERGKPASDALDHT